MMYITIRNLKGDESTEHWCIGQPNPITFSGFQHVISVAADEEELMFVENRFVNLRRVKGSKITRWYGDDACFIVGNLV